MYSLDHMLLFNHVKEHLSLLKEVTMFLTGLMNNNMFEMSRRAVIGLGRFSMYVCLVSHESLNPGKKDRKNVLGLDG